MPAHLAKQWLAGSRRHVCLTIVTLSMVTACGGPQSDPVAPESSPTILGATTSEPTEALETPIGEPCAHGNLRVGDLRQIDDLWRAGVDEARDRAEAWQSDAFLTSFRVGCEVLGPGFRWQATFYSPSLQAYFASDTGETLTSEDDPTKVRDLPTDALSFGLLRRSLTKAGYGDGTELTASTGVEIRINSRFMPFGPPAAPVDAVLYHVAVIHRGEVRDLFVSATDGTIYRYTF